MTGCGSVAVAIVTVAVVGERGRAVGSGRERQRQWRRSGEDDLGFGRNDIDWAEVPTTTVSASCPSFLCFLLRRRPQRPTTDRFNRRNDDIKSLLLLLVVVVVGERGRLVGRFRRRIVALVFHCDGGSLRREQFGRGFARFASDDVRRIGGASSDGLASDVQSGVGRWW